MRLSLAKAIFRASLNAWRRRWGREARNSFRELNSSAPGVIEAAAKAEIQGRVDRLLERVEEILSKSELADFHRNEARKGLHHITVVKPRIIDEYSAYIASLYRSDYLDQLKDMDKELYKREMNLRRLVLTERQLLKLYERIALVTAQISPVQYLFDHLKFYQTSDEIQRHFGKEGVLTAPLEDHLRSGRDVASALHRIDQDRYRITKAFNAQGYPTTEVLSWQLGLRYWWHFLVRKCRELSFGLFACGFGLAFIAERWELKVIGTGCSVILLGVLLDDWFKKMREKSWIKRYRFVLYNSAFFVYTSYFYFLIDQAASDQPFFSEPPQNNGRSPDSP